MAKIDLKNLKSKLQDAAEAAKTAVKDVNLDEVKDKLHGAVDSAVSAVKDIDVGEIKDKIKDTADSTIETVKNVKLSDVKDVFKKKEETSEEDTITTLNIKAVSTRNAVKIIYYLMAADGKVFHSEEDKFNSIGCELDPDFMAKHEDIIAECQKQLDKVIDPEDYYDALQDGVEDALISSKLTADTFITPKLLVWDLLTIAYSDESYDEAERKLVKYIVRKTDIDKTVFLEMESSILTLMDIERELDWIKHTNKPYLTIESMVNELADRKNVIFESVKDLIAL